MAKTRGCLVWIGRIVGILIVLIIIMAGIGYFWEQSAEEQDAENYPAPGMLFHVNDRMMHLYCVGDGSPAIILDAGLGGWSIDYGDLQEQLAQETTICTYDRAGYGWSDSAGGERHAQAIANDLLGLLDAAEMQEPMILVGFSYSGLSTRLFAIQHPNRVAGLILLDPAHEDDTSLYSDDLLRQQQSLVGMYGLFGNLAKIGFVRFVKPEEMAPFAPFIPENQSEQYYVGLSHPQWWQTSQQEFMMLNDGDSAEQVRAAGNLPSDLPLVIIGAEILPEGLPENIEEQRLVSLQSLAAQSDEGQFVIAEDSGHDDIIHRTDLILEALQAILSMLQ